MIDQVKDRLGTEALPMQLPLGEEKDFYGLIDLVDLRGYAWPDESGVEIIEVQEPRKCKFQAISTQRRYILLLCWFELLIPEQ